MEDCYLLPDPNAVRMHPLCLGSHCALCGCMVCAGDACSLFYAKRFCARWGSQLTLLHQVRGLESMGWGLAATLLG